MISINFRDPRPIYEQIKDGMRRLIVSGALPAGSKIISGVTSVWGPLPSPSNVVDFSLTGITKYGLTGFLSQGDQICYTYVNLEKLVQMGCQVIVCACRKRNPDTFNAVAKVAWEYDFSIIWIKFDRPKDVSKDEYTDELSNKIFYLFK